MGKSKLSESIKETGVAAQAESVPEPEETVETWNSEEWVNKNALDIPASIRKQFPGMRFRWLDPAMIDRKGWRNWRAVHTKLSDEEANRFGETHGRSVDSTVQRGTLILAMMPEKLARSREKYQAEINSPEQTRERAKSRLEQEMKLRGAGVIGAVHGSKRKRNRIIPVEGAGE